MRFQHVRSLVMPSEELRSTMRIRRDKELRPRYKSSGVENVFVVSAFVAF